MTYQIPDGWPLPPKIDWWRCANCGMLYGDGDFDQAMLNEFYTKYYGYGVSNPDNVERLKRDAVDIADERWGKPAVVVDFGGAGDDGVSVFVDEYNKHQLPLAVCVGPTDPIPDSCAVIYASHVLEHIYDLPETMQRLTDALAPDGILIVDVPDSTGLLNRWKMPILDFNTKHINHFTLRNLLDLGHRYGLEAVQVKPYELEYAPCVQVHFRRLDVARASMNHIGEHQIRMLAKLRSITGPVNVWGMGDIVWHLLSIVELDVLDYIDNDPAYRGATFNGKPVLERPTNGAPIVIMAQGQRKRLIANIRKMGIENEIIEI